MKSYRVGMRAPALLLRYRYGCYAENSFEDIDGVFKSLGAALGFDCVKTCSHVWEVEIATVVFFDCRWVTPNADFSRTRYVRIDKGSQETCPVSEPSCTHYDMNVAS